MKNISKRIVALVLAVAMMVTSLPTMVSAATNDPIPMNVKVGESFTLTFADGTPITNSDFKGNGQLEFDRNVFEKNGQIPCGVKSTAKTGVYTLTFTNKDGVATTWVITVGPAEGNAPEPAYDYVLYGKQSVDIDSIDDYAKDFSASNQNVRVEGSNSLLGAGITLFGSMRVTGNNVGTAQASYKPYHFKYAVIEKVGDKQTKSIKVVESDTVLNGTIADTMYVGDKANLNITAAPAAGQGAFISAPTVSYETSNEAVVKIENGKLVAVAPGTATITANATNGKAGDAYTGKSKNFVVTVKAGEVVKVEINNKRTNIVNTDTPDFNETVTVRGEVSKEVTWSVSDTNVATIDQNGVLTPIIGNASVTVTATSVADPTKSDSVNVRIDWDSNNGNSSKEHIIVLVKDDAGAIVEGAKVELQLVQLLGWSKVFEAYSNEEGKSTFNIKSYEWIGWAKATKDGYEPAKVDVDEYIGLFTGKYEYVTITMHKIQKYDVTYKYENEIFETDKISENAKVSADMISSATSKAEQYAEVLTRESNEYTYTFAGFDKDLTDVAITDDTVVTAQYNTALKGSKVVSFWQAKGNDVVPFDEDSTSLTKEWLKNKSNDEIKTELSNFIGNKVVDRIEQTADEVQVIFASNVYKFTWVEKDVDENLAKSEDSRIKSNLSRFYAVDVEDYEDEVSDNVNAIIDANNFAENVAIENEEEKWLYQDWTVFKNYGSYTRINLRFVKGLEHPVTIRHQGDFYGKDNKIVDFTEVKSMLVDANGEIINPAGEYDQDKNVTYAVEAYNTYALDDTVAILDTQWSRPTYDETTNTITFKYWSKEVDLKFTKEDEPNFVKKMVKLLFNYIDIDLKQSDDEYAKNELIARELTYTDKDGVIYKGVILPRVENADNKTEGSYTYGSSTYDFEKHQIKKADYSVANKVVLDIEYQYDKQANCKHENTEYVDNGNTHSLVCTDCELVLEKGLRHNYKKHICEECGHVQEGTPITLKMEVAEGLTKAQLGGANLEKAISTKAWTVSEGIADYEENKTTILDDYLAAAKAAGEDVGDPEEDEEDMEKAIRKALEKADNFKDNTIYNVMYESFTQNWYNITVVLDTKASTYSQVELSNVTDFEGVRAAIKAEVARQKNMPAEYKATEIFDEGITQLEYDNVYHCVVTFFSNDENAEEFTFDGNVHLYRHSNRRRKTPEDPIIIDPNITPEAGALLDDLRNNRPNDLITRAEFVGILANIFNVPEDRMYSQNWNLEGCDQKALIERMSTYTIVKGYSIDEFGQNDSITKEQMYTILARTLIFQGKCPGMTEEEIVAQLMNAVNAEQVSDWAREGVSIALKMGLAAATETTPTEPQGNVMRMTAADTLQKYIEVVATPNSSDEVKVVEE